MWLFNFLCFYKKLNALILIEKLANCSKYRANTYSVDFHANGHVCNKSAYDKGKYEHEKYIG